MESYVAKYDNCYGGVRWFDEGMAMAFSFMILLNTLLLYIE